MTGVATAQWTLPVELDGAVAAEVERAEAERVLERVWARDATLWVAGSEAPERLGWLDAPEALEASRRDLSSFAAACAAEFTDAVLLGMGGSSLAPEMLRTVFGSGRLRLHVLDSTDPGAIVELERAVDLRATLFLVSTKSGTTVETLSLYRYLRVRVEALLGDPVAAGERFCAITDPGSPLVELAAAEGFRRTFLADPRVGGRYSALTPFGAVPAALLAEKALDALAFAALDPVGAVAEGVRLGAALGALAVAGRDKLTLAVDPSLGALALWVEQLVAESLGKQGGGIVPVAGETLARPALYGDDRTFLRLGPAASAPAEELHALVEAGHPVLALDVHPAGLGRALLAAEAAVAVAGWSLGVDPFDQPNVQEAKDRTAEALRAVSRGERTAEPEDADERGLEALLVPLEPPSYLAVTAFCRPSRAFESAIERVRRSVRVATGVAVTFGYGPRYLHSTGQLHKGGPPTGAFLQLVHDGHEDVAVPGAGHSFATLKNAQAVGDLAALRAHGRPAARVRLRGEDPAAALEALADRLDENLARAGGRP